MKRIDHFWIPFKWTSFLDDLSSGDLFHWNTWRFNGGNSYSSYRFGWLVIRKFHGNPRYTFTMKKED